MDRRQVSPEKLHCVLHCQSDVANLQQVYAGFSTLARNGGIRLTQKIDKAGGQQAQPSHQAETARASHLVAEVDGMNIGFDVDDAGHVPDRLLSSVDVLFKRVWEHDHIEGCATPDKVLPLGVKLWVHADPPDWHAIKRARLHTGGDYFECLVRALGIDRLLGNAMFTPRWRSLSAKPPLELAPRVLFLADALDPADALTPNAAAERVTLNTQRAACMRALRDRFGDKATCGFRNTPFAQREFADLFFSGTEVARQRDHLKLMRQHPICVASNDGHRSSAGNFGDYLAMSRAIVSEKIDGRLPGEIDAGTHYLPFRDVESCVAAVQQLFDVADIRHDLMRASACYAMQHVRPDALVADSLRRAFAWRETNRG